MRILPIFLTLPLLAATPEMTLRNAAVTWGSGVPPKGEMPPSHFSVDVHVSGKNVPKKPRFRAYVVRADLLSGLKAAQSPSRLKAPALHPLKAKYLGEGHWQLHGPFPHAPESKERLVVELRGRFFTVCWAECVLMEHLIPQGRPIQMEGQE